MLVPKQPSIIGHVTYSICFSPDGRLIASGGSDKMVRVWEVATGLCLRTFIGHREAVNSVSFSPDGTLIASAGADKRVILWNFETRKTAGVFWHEDGVNAVAFSPDGRYLVSASEDKTIKLWDRRTRTCVRTLDGHTAGVGEVSFSPDARYILSCSESGIHNVFSLLWFLDWELEERDSVDWDEGARLHMENFLILHTPYAAKLPADRGPKQSEITRSLTRKGVPTWGEKDFEQLMLELRRTGYSHLNPDGVRRKLERTVREWEASPPQLLHSYTSPLFTLGCAVASLIILAVIVYFVWPLLFYLLG
jgi:WD40 repeat protein